MARVKRRVYILTREFSDGCVYFVRYMGKEKSETRISESAMTPGTTVGGRGEVERSAKCRFCDFVATGNRPTEHAAETLVNWKIREHIKNKHYEEFRKWQQSTRRPK